MPRRPAAYPAAYREQIIALARAGRSSKELAKKFEPWSATSWEKQRLRSRGSRGRSRPSLRGRERESGPCSGSDDVPRMRAPMARTAHRGCSTISVKQAITSARSGWRA